MILLDTNVVSELMRDIRARHPLVIAFINASSVDNLYIPSIVAAEIRYGLQRLPAGRRRDEMQRNFEAFLAAGFGSRILVFDDDCARCYAVARTLREAAGRPFETEDALIGGMALAFGAVLATRNIKDFDGYGLSLINPWESDN